MSERMPHLWSDFDGTAVGIVPKTNWRNWTKYPLPPIDGYVDFLQGVEQEGVEIAGIVSRRPNIAPRRLATARSVAQLGLDRYFPGKHQVVLTGSEWQKATFVANEGSHRRVGMIEDKPHVFVPALMSVLDGISPSGNRKIDIVVGAVDHGRRDEYLERLADVIKADQAHRLREESDGFYVEHASFPGRDDRFNKYRLRVVPVEPYSEAAGQAFAQELTAA